MNKRLTKNVLFDTILWALIGVGLYGGNVYASNVVLFFAAGMGVLMIICGFAVSYREKLPDNFPQAPTKTHRTYRNMSTGLEVLLIAGAGHFVVATIYGLGFVAYVACVDSAREKQGAK